MFNVVSKSFKIAMLVSVFLAALLLCAGCVSLPEHFPDATTVSAPSQLQLSILDRAGPLDGMKSPVAATYRKLKDEYGSSVALYSFDVLFWNRAETPVVVQPMTIRLEPAVKIAVSGPDGQSRNLATSVLAAKHCCGFWESSLLGGIGSGVGNFGLFPHQDFTLPPGKFAKRRLYFPYARGGKPGKLVFLKLYDNRVTTIAEIPLP